MAKMSEAEIGPGTCIGSLNISTIKTKQTLRKNHQLLLKFKFKTVLSISYFYMVDVSAQKCLRKHLTTLKLAPWAFQKFIGH
jgi:hypothetical protein